MLQNTQRFKYAALLGDSTSFEVFKPGGPYYREAKLYYDGKNGIYAIKKQVCVLARSPHYALFISPGYAGSTHDFTILKDTYDEIGLYLEKTDSEHNDEDSSDSWSILMDKGYIGPEDSHLD